MAIFDNVDTAAELSQAITTSANNGEADTINITGDITLAGLLPLIEEDDQLTIDGNNNTINGSNQYRLFFVRSGTVNFNNLTFSNGRARGGDGGGGAAGMGGALFVFNGTVTVTDSTFQNNSAMGGNGGTGRVGGNANFTSFPRNNGMNGGPGENGGNGASASRLPTRLGPVTRRPWLLASTMLPSLLPTSTSAAAASMKTLHWVAL